MHPLHFEETDGTEIAEVTKEGKVTAREVGAFKVKVSTDGNGYFKSAGSSEKELTIHPGKTAGKGYGRYGRGTNCNKSQRWNNSTDNR